MHKIYRRDRLFVIVDDAGATCGTYPSVETAQAALELLRRKQQQARASDPAIQEQRTRKAAYRLVERDPLLQALKNILPRKGEIERNTKRGYAQSLAVIDRCMTMGSSDPVLHAVLQRTPSQRRTAAATEMRQQQRDETRQKYRALHAQGKSQKEAARILGITPRGLRKIITGR